MPEPALCMTPAVGSSLQTKDGSGTRAIPLMREVLFRVVSEHFGPAPCAYRIRVRRCSSPAVSTIRPLRRQAMSCC